MCQTFPVCCARASGQPAAAPPMSVMNSRRLKSNMRPSPSGRTTAHSACNRRGGPVLGAHLNCSESVWALSGSAPHMIARQQEPAAVRNLNPVYVRFGSKADFAPCLDFVRFAPESGHRAPRPTCPLCANSGREQMQKVASSLRRTRCPGGSTFQFAFELVKQTPISRIGNDFVGARLDHTGFAQPQRIEPDSIGGIVLTPFVVGNFLQHLQRIV